MTHQREPQESFHMVLVMVKAAGDESQLTSLSGEYYPFDLGTIKNARTYFIEENRVLMHFPMNQA